MQKYKIGCLPVVADGLLVGIVTDSDYVALAINLLEQLEVCEEAPDDFDDEDELSGYGEEEETF
jgi:predicted transcriptional regulator